MKVLQHVHGTAVELHDRFQILLNSGIIFSKICMLIRSAPKILNQKPHSIQDKLRFLCGEMGDSLDYLEVFPAYLCFDLENRISPRFRFHKWLVEKGFSEKSYSIASIVATSEKAFIARLYGIHPAIPKHCSWEQCTLEVFQICGPEHKGNLIASTQKRYKISKW
ncbi:unnamed protein product [Arabidopsis thaliana]|uniref:(thale cress) hypothetical protein n=1 Tax=Arabidopsis thaliana TaxID=3702 RepID=A0A7G2ESS1_ARATH|nr:unnamed protein product [Arabidopsis thaliana]